MDRKFDASLKLSLQQLKGKVFKVVADTVRSGISNEHGFRATKGVTDKRLKQWPIVIRFSTRANRERFMTTMNRVLHPLVVEQISLKPLTPHDYVKKPHRWAKSA